MLYNLVKVVHILFVIAAVGSNISYGFWQGRTGDDQQLESFVLRTVKWIDDHIANPAYGLVLLTGLIMVFWHWSLGVHWIQAALVLYVIAMGFALIVYSPALKRQIDLLAIHGVTSTTYRQAAWRATVFGISIAVPILIILFLMVGKPAL